MDSDRAAHGRHVPPPTLKSEPPPQCVIRQAAHGRHVPPRARPAMLGSRRAARGRAAQTLQPRVHALTAYALSVGGLRCSGRDAGGEQRTIQAPCAARHSRIERRALSGAPCAARLDAPGETRGASLRRRRGHSHTAGTRQGGLGLSLCVRRTRTLAVRMGGLGR